MKGAVFIALNDMIESQFGIDVWEELLEKVKPSGDGIYISTEDYPDEDIVNFVLVISEKLKLDSTDVTRIFGKYLFGELNKSHPIFTSLADDLFDFLNSIENVIHKEVKKLYENPNLPSLETSTTEGVLEMRYESPRKLCFLAEGLIFGAAEHYKEEVVIEHPVCMHKGSDHCDLLVIKKS